MRAYKCDACGSLFDRPYTPNLKITLYIHCYGEQQPYDLCPVCYGKIEDMLHVPEHSRCVKDREWKKVE